MNVEGFHSRLKELYAPPQELFSVIDIPEIRFAVIDGDGDPQGEESAAAVKWLYSLVHIVKPAIQERMGKRFAYPPLEFLHRTDAPEGLVNTSKDGWHWRAMIVFIDWISEDDFANAVIEVEKKLGPVPKTLRLENFTEGRCVQTMHVGDYAQIGSICEKLYGDYLPKNNLTPSGCYHEIYLSDPSRTAPDKRKTIIRQAVANS